MGIFKQILEHVKAAAMKVVSTAKKILGLEAGEVSTREVIRVCGYATVITAGGVLLYTSAGWLAALTIGCVTVLLCDKEELQCHQVKTPQEDSSQSLQS